MNEWLLSLVSVTAVSAASLVGVLLLSADEARVRRLAVLLVSFAVGALLGDVFLHLIPAAFSGARSVLRSSLLVLAGMLLFFAVEKLLRHRHEILCARPDPPSRSLPELAAINLVGDALHNCVDGALIAASYLASPELGAATTLAVLLHELPQELGDFAVLVHSGLGVRKAVWANLASASTAIAAAVVTLLLGSAAGEWIPELGIPVTAGGFLYIAAADLIPELQRDRTLRGFVAQLALICGGIGAMVALTFLE